MSVTFFHSIRRYLLVYLIAALVAGSVLVVVFTYFHVSEEINELYDSDMVEIAETLQVQIEGLGLDRHPITGLAGPSLETKLRHEQEFLIQIWNTQRQIVYTSHHAIAFPLQERQGLVFAELNGRAWRTYIVKMPNFIIQIAQPQKIRTKFIRQMALNLLYPMLALIPLIGLFIWCVVGLSLRPLSDVSRAIQLRSASSLEPLSGFMIPTEIQPIVHALNELLDRLKHSIEAQKRFTADAAHELRSPLAALQLQLDLLKRTQDEPARAHASIKLQEGIDRATHVVRQLLTLARMEPASAHAMAPVDLAQLSHDILERYASLAMLKHIEVGISLKQAALTLGNAEMLATVIENVIDNAIRYTQEGGNIDVRVYTRGEEAVIEICDNGIGIPEHERTRIFERFYRVVGTDTQGTGIGLAIVKSIVEHHKGEVAVHTGMDGKGTRVVVRLPALAPNA